MIVNPQNLRGIYVGFNTLFNKALTTVDPLYKQIATVTPSTTCLLYTSPSPRDS